MSMLMGYVSKDSILMASDTRSCINFEGKYQAINDTTQKLFILDKSSMLFGCGSLHVISTLAKHIKMENIRNIQKITQIAKKLTKDYIMSGGIADKNGCVQIFYAQLIDGIPYIHITSDSIKWEIVSQKGEDIPIPFFGGYGAEIASKEYYKDADKSQADFISVVRKAFDLASSVHVGGALKVATLSNDGITTQEFPICDTDKDIKWLDKDKLISKFANALGGSMQLGSTHITEAMFRTNNGNQSSFFNSNFDSSNNVHGGAVQVGTLHANRIQANTITAGQIAANTITAQQIQAGSITGDRIAANSITGNQIMANSITSNHIQAGAITANMITAGTMSADRIQGGSIVGSNFRLGGWFNSELQFPNGSRLMSVDPPSAIDFWGHVHTRGLANQGNMTNNGQRVLTTADLTSLSALMAWQMTELLSIDDGKLCVNEDIEGFETLSGDFELTI